MLQKLLSDNHIYPLKNEQPLLIGSINERKYYDFIEYVKLIGYKIGSVYPVIETENGLKLNTDLYR